MIYTQFVVFSWSTTNKVGNTSRALYDGQANFDINVPYITSGNSSAWWETNTLKMDVQRTLLVQTWWKVDFLLSFQSPYFAFVQPPVPVQLWSSSRYYMTLWRNRCCVVMGSAFWSISVRNSLSRFNFVAENSSLERMQLNIDVPVPCAFLFWKHIWVLVYICLGLFDALPCDDEVTWLMLHHTFTPADCFAYGRLWRCISRFLGTSIWIWKANSQYVACCRQTRTPVSPNILPGDWEVLWQCVRQWPLLYGLLCKFSVASDMAAKPWSPLTARICAPNVNGNKL